MSQILIEIPEETLLALELSPEDAGEELRFAGAAKLYELRRLSSGAAARLAGVTRVTFLARLSEYGVDALDLDDEDLSRETRLG